jgi:hypothetical protein
LYPTSTNERCQKLCHQERMTNVAGFTHLSFRFELYPCQYE